MKAWGIFLVGLGAINFVWPSAAAERTGVFSGRYTIGFETSEFIPCGKEVRWWLTGNLSAINAMLSPSSGGGMQTVFIRVTGRLSPPGRYGHLGAYKRELTVDRVLRARAPRPSDCR